MTKRSKTWSLVIVICLLSTPIVKAVQVERVTNNNNDGPGSLRQAIIDVSPGGQVLFSPQVEGSTIVLTSGALSISKSLSIINNSDNRVTITTQGKSQVVRIDDRCDVLITGLNIDSGYIPPDASDINSRGGGIFSEGRLRLEECTINNCQSAYGGGVWADSLKMSHCTISNNKSYKDGGGICANVMIAKYSAINKNEAQGRIEKMRSGNVFADGSAGGLMITQYLEISQSTISNNKAGLNGGGIYLTNQNASLTMYNCTVIGNVAREGGGLYCAGDIDLLTNNIIATNQGSRLATADINPLLTWTNQNLIQNNLIGIWGGPSVFPGSNHILGSISEPLDPILGPPSNNGDDSEIYSLEECSPAIDKGYTLSNTDTDQLGLARTVGSSTDIGAIEYQQPNNRMCETYTCDSLVANAGIDKGVLYSNRGFFGRYSCVDLSAKASGGLAPYSYIWSSDIDPNNTTAAVITTCPTQDVTYTLTVVDANGCIATDEVAISAYSFREARRIQNCGNSSFRVVVCDPNTNTSRCANIYSNSNSNGLGPLLNAGFYPGPCSNIVADEAHLKSSTRYIDKVWPIPSRGEINFIIRKSDYSNLTFQVYNQEMILVKETIVRSAIGKSNTQFEQIIGLSRGRYTYVTISEGVIADRGTFYVEE